MSDFESEISYLLPTGIRISGNNPRRSFNKDAMKELTKSIKEHGILEPLIVRPIEDAGDGLEVELVAGERRLKAALDLQLQLVPCIIREMDDATAAEIMLLENLQREDLTPMEEARAINAILELTSVKQKTLGKKLGKTQSWIANRVRLLSAPEKLQELLEKGEITPRHVMALLKYVEHPELFKAIVKDFLDHVNSYPSTSVKDTEELIREILLAYQHDKHHVLCLNVEDPPYWLNNLTEAKDFAACKKCQKTIMVKPRWGNEKVRVCIEFKCIQKLVNKALKKAKKNKQLKLDKIAAQSTDTPIYEQIIDTSEIYSHCDFRYLFDHNGVPAWDHTGCSTCKDHRFTEHNREICINYDCAVKKEKLREKELKHQARETWKYIIASVEDRLERNPVDATPQLAWLLEPFALEMGMDAICRAAKHFDSSIKIHDSDKAQKVLKALEGQDIWKALVWCTVEARVGNSPYTRNEDSFKGAFPKLFRHYKKYRRAEEKKAAKASTPKKAAAKKPSKKKAKSLLTPEGNAERVTPPDSASPQPNDNGVFPEEEWTDRIEYKSKKAEASVALVLYEGAWLFSVNVNHHQGSYVGYGAFPSTKGVAFQHRDEALTAALDDLIDAQENVNVRNGATKPQTSEAKKMIKWAEGLKADLQGECPNDTIYTPMEAKK